MPINPWWRNTVEAPLGSHFDNGSLGRRELLKQALNNGTTLHCKTYSGYRLHNDISGFLNQLSERLQAPIVLCVNHTSNVIYNLINDHSVIGVTVDIYRENTANQCRPYSGAAGTPKCDGVTVCIDTLRTEDIAITDELCRGGLEDKHEPGVVSVLVQEAMGIGVRTLGRVTSSLIRENYDPDIMEKVDKLLRNLRSKAPQGRLTIINGTPGTGKTHLLQGVVNELEEVNSWFVPPQLLIDLAGPQLLGVLLGRDTTKPLLLLLEDGDNCLVTRGTDNMSSIQALLNIADGFIGQMLNIHVLVTTNATRLDIDNALLRPGRLHQHIHIDTLDPEHAGRIYQRLTGRTKDYGSFSVTLAQVYKDAAE